MITKFKEIKNMAVFKNFAWDSSAIEQGRPIAFKQVNVLYGRNYSGKTTLSRIVRAFETGNLSDKYETPSFALLMDDGKELTESDIQTGGLLTRVFNEDFIRENLQFVVNPNSDIVPFAVLGEDNARIEAEIKKILNRLGSDDKESPTGLYARKAATDNAYKQAEAAHTTAEENLSKLKRKKATDQKNGIKYQISRYNMQNYDIRKLNEDIENVLSDSYQRPNDTQIALYEAALTEEKKNPAKSFDTPQLALPQLVVNCRELCERRIGSSKKIQELLRDAALEQWVKQGMVHNSGRKICAFCGQTITGTRWDELNKHFDEETEGLLHDIEIFIKKTESERARVSSCFNPDKTCFYAAYTDELDNIISEYETFKVAYESCLDQLRALAEKRKKSLHKEIAFDYEDQKLTCNTVFTNYKALQEKSNSYSDSIHSARSAAQTALRYIEVERFLGEIGYKEQVDSIKNLKKIAEQKRKDFEAVHAEIIDLEKEIADKRRLLNDEEKGAQRINDLLCTYFGHKYLSLQAVESEGDNNKHTHFEVVRNGKKAFHLSEGECSLIAFCYFIARLGDVDTVGKKPIIWIDDPISSLDGNHIYFVYSLITQEILAKDAYDQLFITTHNLQFLKYLRVLSINNHNPKEKGIARTNMLIERRGDDSIIVSMPKYLKEHGTEFNHWFECIYKCASISSLSDENVYLLESFGNNARKFLETYLYYRYPDKDNFNNHLSKFFGAYEVPQIIVRKVSDELSHGDGDLENHDIPFDEPEVIAAAKLLLDRLKAIDEEQFNSLLSSIQ